MLNVFLSYTGEQFDHCGIAIRSPKVSPELLASALSIKTDQQENSSIEGDRLVSRLADTTRSRYGANFIIEPKLGLSLAEALQGLSSENVDVIVEILACK